MKAIVTAPQSVRSILFALVGLVAGALVETAWAQPAPLYSNGPMVSVPVGRHTITLTTVDSEILSGVLVPSR